jgi:hypothetical protein
MGEQSQGKKVNCVAVIGITEVGIAAQALNHLKHLRPVVVLGCQILLEYPDEFGNCGAPLELANKFRTELAQRINARPRVLRIMLIGLEKHVSPFDRHSSALGATSIPNPSADATPKYAHMRKQPLVCFSKNPGAFS